VFIRVSAIQEIHPMVDIVTFGEAMIRLSPPPFQRLEQARSLDIQVGGAEFNVAADAARLGLRTAWVSRLPGNALGRIVAARAREHGVDTSSIAWAREGRAGLYFYEFGASPRPSSVLYDREDSAISRIAPKEIPWDAILKGARVFHVSGITPALSPSAARVTEEALAAAKAAGATVSYDLNYRKKLWSPEEARRVQEPLMRHVDLLITNEEDPFVVFGVSSGRAADGAFRSVSAEAYREIAGKLRDRFGFKAVAVTLRESPSVLKNFWSAAVLEGDRFHEDRKYELEIVDRLGGGDSFSAGLLYGFLTRGSLEYGLRFGNAYSALKHSNPGDVNLSTKEEVEQLLQGGGARVVR
jgi:2-dehydro-3-deoxygluconokinase